MADRAVRACFHAAFWLSLSACTWLALVPTPPAALGGISHVIQHGAAFAWLAFAIRFAFARLGPGAAGLWMLGYGALLEVVQALGGVRVGELGDLAVDAAGILIGLGAYRLVGASVRTAVERAVRSLVTSNDRPSTGL